MSNRIQIRRDTAANWTSVNPVLAQGELGLETDTGNLKAGDGSTAWGSLGYGPIGSIAKPVVGSGIDWTGTADSTAALNTFLANVTPGAALYLPAGTLKLTGTITISKAKVKLSGPGVLNFASGIASSPALDITADGVTVNGVTIINGTTGGTQTGALGQPVNRNVGIFIEANDTLITGCRLESFQNGIVVSAYGEYEHHTITDNRIKDIYGAGDGPSNSTSTYGEDRGDGIVTWGSTATITGNVINAAPGTDARIGIHHEALGDRAVTLTPLRDSMVTVSGNVVYGKFRRGISFEGTVACVMTGNVVADATWWGISAVALSQSCIISSNTVRWTRQSTDNQGSYWSPKRVPILVYGPGVYTGSGHVVSSNTVHIEGTCDAMMMAQSQDNTVLAAPVLSAPTTATTGGTLAAATYFYKATYTNVAGETVGSNEISQATTGSASTVTFTIGAAPSGAAGMRIYRSTSTGGEVLLDTLGTTPTSYTDNGSKSPGTATVPTANTTGKYPKHVLFEGNMCRVISGSAPRGISFEGNTEHVSVVNNTFVGFTGQGFYGYAAHRGRICGNVFVGTSANIGVQFDQTPAAGAPQVTGNLIEGCATGISAPNTPNCLFSSNTIDSATTGIDLYGCTTSKAIGNIFISCTTNVANPGSNTISP